MSAKRAAQKQQWGRLAQGAEVVDMPPITDARNVPLAWIEANPWQPRQHTDPERMQELQEDIAARGILQPLVIRKLDLQRYQVVAGERRYRAAQALQLEDVPALIVTMDDATARAASVRENVHREDMDPEDEGNYYRALQEQGMSLRDIAAAIGKSHQYVNRRIKLVEDPAALLAYRQGLVNMHDIVAGAVPPPLPAQPVPLAEAATVPEELPAAETVTNGNSRETAHKPFRRPDSVFKPFHTFHTTLQRLDPTTVTPEARPDLAATIDTLIEELQAIKAELGNDGTT